MNRYPYIAEVTHMGGGERVAERLRSNGYRVRVFESAGGAEMCFAVVVVIGRRKDAGPNA